MQKNTSVTGSGLTAQLAALKQNNEAALKALYLENYPKIESYVLNNNGTAEEAKDVFQEAFIAVWRSVQLDKFTPHHQTSLSGYLYRVAKNKWLDHLRSGRYKRTVPLQAVEDGDVAAEELTGDEESHLQAATAAFSKLGEACRELLKRFYFGKESLRTIASAFGWTEATAKNNKYRCLQGLREGLKNN